MNPELALKLISYPLASATFPHVTIPAVDTDTVGLLNFFFAIVKFAVAVTAL